MPEPGFNRILAPTDLSDSSWIAVQFALSWANSFNALLRLINVNTLQGIVPLDAGFMAGPPVPVKIYEEIAKHALANYIETLPDGTHSISGEVRSHESTWEAIVESAEEWKTDLVVMTTHARKDLGHLIMGSTASRVIEQITCPVLLLRPGKKEIIADPDLIRRIVVPTDLSTSSIRALPYAEVIADHFNAELVFIHCIEINQMPGDYASALFQPVMNKDVIFKVLKEKMREILPEETDQKVVDHAFICSGRPDREILKHVSLLNGDLIVMATHGHSGRRHTLVGSTTSKVIRNAPCPVLLVPDNEEK